MSATRRPSANQESGSPFSRMRKMAIDDYNKKKMRYYHFGLLPLSEKTKELTAESNSDHS